MAAAALSPSSSSSPPSSLSTLHSLNAYFDDVVDMIPASFYITDFTEKEEEMMEEKVVRDKYKKGQSKENKEAKKALEKIKKKEKYSLNSEKTTDVKKRKWDEVRASAVKAVSGDSNSDSDDEDDETSSTAPFVSDDSAESANPPPVPAFEARPGESRIEALRRKLALKISSARQGRPDGSSVSKRAARRAKKERSKSATDKAGFSNAESGKKRSRSESDAELAVPAKKTSISAAAPKDDLSGLDFGMISGLKSTPAHKQNKSLANLGKKKSLDSMLVKAEAKKAKLRALKQSNDPEDKAKHDSIVWGDALKSATGATVRDDPALIKKAMKRKDAAKSKSAKKWADRITTVASSMMEKQKIRKHNLQQRRLGGSTGANLSSKKIVEEKEEGKRGRKGPHSGRAGFEGKKDSFINGGEGKEGGKNQQ